MSDYLRGVKFGYGMPNTARHFYVVIGKVHCSCVTGLQSNYRDTSPLTTDHLCYSPAVYACFFRSSCEAVFASPVRSRFSTRGQPATPYVVHVSLFILFATSCFFYRLVLVSIILPRYREAQPVTTELLIVARLSFTPSLFLSFLLWCSTLQCPAVPCIFAFFTPTSGASSGLPT